MAKIQVGAAITESVRFVRHAWEVAPAALVLVVLTATAIQGFNVVHAGAPLWLLAELLVALPVSIIAVGALYRSVLAADHPGGAGFTAGPGGLQWGAVELRVLGARLMVGLPLAMLLFLIVIGAVIAAQSADPAFMKTVQSDPAAGLDRLASGPGSGPAALVLAPGLAVLFYLWARFSLFEIAAADTSRFDFRAAWSMTRGATGAIVVTAIVIALAELVVDQVAMLFGTLVAGITGSGDAALLGAIAGAAAGSAFSLPMGVGLLAYVYRAQRAGGPG